MDAASAYTIIYAPLTREHVRAIDAKHYGLIRRTIEQQLRHEPQTETRNRKPLKRPIPFDDDEATWEIRFGPQNVFRVFYMVNAEEHTVAVLAIGVKHRNRLRIGDEEINL